MPLLAPVRSLPPKLGLTRPDLGIRIRPPVPVVIDTAFLAGAEASTAADLATNILLDLVGDSSAGAESATGVLLAGVGDAASDADGVAGIGVGAAEVSSGADGGVGLTVVVVEASTATDVTTIAVSLIGGEQVLATDLATAGVAPRILWLRIMTTEFTKIVDSREP